ncbi:Dehydrogenase, E1 component [Penicillium expansum]|uniref:2-oxoisovalerate dehydrogenase subunit alpha n=1 Tax=Penicillium expansum TaxID=27334 RepID=A0A0A2L349_PENEN|nr:Dehydrogenase, E1 component [Penicillium expansum]KGO41060.1 Dehydrogenase, E1 component [Penicillium expansum]KGO58873.1 Dehydrogenase, E1 component [Penicillium expansum]KGO73608.1 Dehydrogenase, E1 component [Penicillium expansum]
MASPGINARVRDLETDREWRISVAVFRYQQNGHYAVLLLKRATGTATLGWWNLPTGPVLHTDATIRDAVKRIVLDKTGLGLQGYHIIQEVDTLTWGSEEKVVVKLNFVIHDTSADIVAIHRNEFFEYEWVEEEQIDSLTIPVSMQEVIRDGQPVTTARIIPARRWSSSISQPPGADSVRFPGAVNSKFTSEMAFLKASDLPAIPTYRVMDSDGYQVDKTRPAPDVTNEEVLSWYKNMLSVSVMDVVMFEAQRQGRLSFYMVSAGEEGITVGSAAALTPDDVVFAQYREAGVFQQRGFTLKNFMSQLFANCNDTGRGRNMPVHYGQNYPRMHTISSPLATQIPQAAGAAYALKLQDLQNPNRDPRIVACYFGEGAASEGDFHAALNIAATRSCPVVFICRNNGYAISTPTLEQYRGDGIASRGVGYGIDTIRVDGNDIFAVNEAMKEARRLALSEGGRPVLIEAMSYRVSHHSTSDDSFAYRARVEVEDWKRRDNPIIRLRKWLENQGIWSEEQEKQTRDEMRKAVLKEFGEAEQEKKPSLREAFADVYEEITEEQREQMAELKRILETYPDEYDLRPYKDGINGLD